MQEPILMRTTLRFRSSFTERSISSDSSSDASISLTPETLDENNGCESVELLDGARFLPAAVVS